MAHEVIMIVPRQNTFVSLPEQYHTTERVSGSDRETQVALIGEAMVSAVERAQTHPDWKNMPDAHFVIMFATIERDDA